MKKVKQLLLVAVAMILVSAISIAATFAYLYDDSETARNTFTIGKIELHLDEAKVNEDGKPVDENGNEVALADAPRVLNNHYKLLPNRTYIKDPTVYVEEGSEPCILFVLIYMPSALKNVIKYAANSTDPEDLGVQFVANGWSVHTNIPKTNADGTGNGYYMWLKYTDGNTAAPKVFSGGAIVPIFESITVKSDASYADLEKASAAEMEITAFAFQYEELGDEVNYKYIIDSLNEAYDLYGD